MFRSTIPRNNVILKNESRKSPAPRIHKLNQRETPPATIGLEPASSVRPHVEGVPRTNPICAPAESQPHQTDRFPKRRIKVDTIRC